MTHTIEIKHFNSNNKSCTSFSFQVQACLSNLGINVVVEN